MEISFLKFLSHKTGKHIVLFLSASVVIFLLFNPPSMGKGRVKFTETDKLFIRNESCQEYEFIPVENALTEEIIDLIRSIKPSRLSLLRAKGEKLWVTDTYMEYQVLIGNDDRFYEIYFSIVQEDSQIGAYIISIHNNTENWKSTKCIPDNWSWISYSTIEEYEQLLNLVKKYSSEDEKVKFPFKY